MVAHTSLRCCAGLGTDEPDERGWWLRDTIAEVGWAVVALEAETAHAFTVGLWHSFGLAELAMFGLEAADMQVWLNAAVEALRVRGQILDGEPFDGVLTGFPVLLEEVHPSWNEPLFGAMCGYYGVSEVPVRQVVWPDRDGRWPWQGTATEACRLRQPSSWLPVSEHPAGAWRLVAELSADWPFVELQPDSTVTASPGVVAGLEPIIAVTHDGEGGWDFLDFKGYVDDLERVHFGQLYQKQPWLARFAELPADTQACLDDDGEWRMRPFDVGASA
jgi:hypothetical protein